MYSKKVNLVSVRIFASVFVNGMCKMLSYFLLINAFSYIGRVLRGVCMGCLISALVQVYPL